jgi:hypothetical protein
MIDEHQAMRLKIENNDGNGNQVEDTTLFIQG